MPSNHFKSSLAIDLGATYTGICSVNHYEGTPVTADSVKTAVIVLPENDSGFVYSMKHRTAVRHRIRSKKRFHLARRLLLLIVKEQLKKKNMILTSEETLNLTQALSGLLKRRGYSRLETETDLTVLEKVDAGVFSTHSVLGQYFCEGTSLAEQWEAKTNHLADISRFMHDEHMPTDKEFRAYLKETFPEYSKESKIYAEALSTLKADAESIVNQKAMGHLHRTQYLKAIRAEIAQDSRLRPAIEAFAGEDALWRLVGNLSNLQLRANRWYFNDPEMLTEDQLKPSRLQGTLVRAFKYFHPEQTDKMRLQALISQLENSDDVIQSLCQIDPELTIPPYEDQNNRRPPSDQTLWLNPIALRAHFADRWLIWADSLLRADPALDGDLDEILALTDRRSRVRSLTKQLLPVNDYRASYILQRALDRTRLRDPYSLRLLSSNATSQAAINGKANLIQAIGSQHVQEFLSMASLYYAEVNKAKSGLWMPQEACLLERSDIHPPMKKKVLDILVGNVFTGDAQLGQKIREHWLDKVHGNSSVASLCRSIESVRKDYGNEFNSLYRQIGKSSVAVDKAIKDVQKKVLLLTEFFSTLGFLTPRQIKNISNPYSLAQLYTLIETDRQGFTSTTLAAHLENAWRMNDLGDGLHAQCSRLTADSVRPFDGSLRRCLERTAWEVSGVLSEEILQRVTTTNTDIDVNLIIEQNKFEFSASLAELKKNRLAQKKAEKLTEQVEQKWQSKKDALMAASCGICAYTGQPIGQQGEIDHIIPRCYTTQRHGTIFNSAVNLIYVSQIGNQNKKDRMYWLHDLHPKYLAAVFKTTDCAQIEKEIEDGVEVLVKTHRLKTFDLLSDREKTLCRHALFLPDGSSAKEEVLNVLGTLRKTKVNGTQAWYLRELMVKIRTRLDAWLQQNDNRLHFDALQVDAQKSHSIRDYVAQENTALKKTRPQPVLSHAIDAICCYAQACSLESWTKKMDAPAEISFNAKALLSLVPKHSQLIHVSARTDSQKSAVYSRPIFKEGIIAQDFLPILIKNQDIFVGFALPKKGEQFSEQAVQVVGKTPRLFLEPLMEFLEPKLSPESLKDGTYWINKTKALEFLHQVATQETSIVDQEKATVLESLTYFTTKATVESRILEKNGKSFKTREDFLNEKPFTIKLDCSINKQKVKGTVKLSSWYEWRNICDIPEIAAHLGKEVAGVDINSLLCRQRQPGSKRSHGKTRRVFSLPILATTSGVVRIQKRFNDTLRCIQLRNVNQAKFCAFAQENGQLNWSKPVMRSVFESSHVSAHKARFNPVNGHSKTPMTEWRTVYQKDITIEISPGSLGRRMIRLTMPFDMFKQWTGCQWNSIYELPSRVKGDVFKNQNTELQAVLGKPRGDLTFEALGETVKFIYTVDSSSSVMNTAYDQGVRMESKQS